MNNDIIPITYQIGTGGNFLCHFLIGAKQNNHQLPTLSEYGNAHEGCLRDFAGNWANTSSTDELNIKIMIRQSSYTTAGKPYFAALHVFDADLINSYFKKSIRIVYDSDDINELATIFYGKWVTWVRKTERSNEHIISTITNESSLFCKNDNLTNILFVSWKELFKEDVEDLILKLSTFTGIDPSNFSRESIKYWREKTQYCLDTFSHLIPDEIPSDNFNR
jgi:hypothetical protein